MKKLLSVLIICALLVPGLCLQTSAAKTLPFEISSPSNVALVWLEGRDSPTTCGFAYSMQDDIVSFLADLRDAEDKSEFLAPYGLTDFWVNVQVDWAMDDVTDPVSGWHANDFWSTENEGHYLGYDNEWNLRVGPWDFVEIRLGAAKTVNAEWLFRYVNEEEWNGNSEAGTPGLKDQVRSGQISYNSETGAVIDFTKHTLYSRARLVFVSVSYDEGLENDVYSYQFSDWSATAAFGKDGEKKTYVTKSELTAPVISDLHMTDKEFNGQPVVAFTLTVPDALANAATRAAALQGSIRVFTEARIKGDTEWVNMGNTDDDVTPGELECALITLADAAGGETLTKDVQIELRCRYCCSQPDMDDIYSPYSEILSFGATLVNPFVDVPEGKWYTESILYCFEHGYMTGTSSDIFNPNSPFSRAMFVTVLAKIDGADTTEYTGTSFTDVPEGKWYSKPIQWAFMNSYASGIGNNKFGPSKAVTRQEMAQFLYNYTVKKGMTVENFADIGTYADYMKVAAWAKTGVEWAVGNGMISGTGNNTLTPKGTATRAQVAVIVKNYVEKFVEK